jgi:hypothetical protein
MTTQRSLTELGRLEFGAPERPLVQGKDFLPFSFSADNEFSGKVIFAGYGIVSQDRGRDDFAGIDVNGRLVLMFPGEPPNWADKNGFPSPHAMPRSKVYNAKDRGATAVLMVNVLPGEGETDRLTPFDADSADEYGLPAFHVTRAVVDEALKAGGYPSLSELESRLNTEGGKGTASMDLPAVKAAGKAAFQTNRITTRNVIGRITGTDPSAGTVVIGAHYDHLGKRKPMMRKFKQGKLVQENIEPEIHNGADDNASGVAGLIEIARMFAAGPKPRRNVLFIAFTGEEAGLHGSKFYIGQPSEPLDATVAMLNMDMIGRMPRRGKKLQVFGLSTATEFPEIVGRAANRLRFSIQEGHDAGGRSDHAPFVRRKIPAMHFFTGHHEDYHKPSDDAKKINARGGAGVAELVYRVALDLANREGRPTFQEPKTPMDQPTPTATYRVVMGLAPSYVNDGQPGMGVDGVTAQGPADLAGMKSGDRILRINNKPIANIYDYMASTRGNSPGDVVEVVILRDGKEKSLKVTLAGTK